MIWTSYDWLNFYICYMATLAVIINGHGLGIDAHRVNYPNKSQLVLYKALIHCNSRQKQLYFSNKMELFSIKVDVAYVNVSVSKQLKEKLAWAIDKRLQIITNKMLFKTVIPLRN